MVFRQQPRKRGGFTLIEMLVVITILSTLALIVIPRVHGATRKGREAAMAANLYQLRVAISRFQSDTGLYPMSLEDLVRPQSEPPIFGYTADGQQARLPAASMYSGPYLLPYTGIDNKGLPYNPLTDYRASDLDKQWKYRFDLERGEGIVTCPVGMGNTMSGIPYENL